MLYVKAAHIIFVVTWFSGMFYLVRLFIYHREAQEKDPNERDILSKQYKVMIPRLLFGITLPSAIITLFLGTTLVGFYGVMAPWLMLKFSFLLPLFLYHISLHHIWKSQKNGNFKYSSKGLRIWNELATLLLVAIVFTAVLKDTSSFIYGVAGFVILAGLILLGMRLFKSSRT